MKKRIMSFALTLLMCLTLLPVTAFAEDHPSSWAEAEVNAAISVGIVPQSLQSNYTQTITRAEFCAIAVALYENIKGEIAGRTKFNDTADVNVEKAAYIGVVAGVGNGSFSPGSQLTREQAAAMLARLAGVIDKKIPVQAVSFSDSASISSWARESVGQMQVSGIMSGIGNNIFSPAGSYTREQSILTALRLFVYKNLVDTIPPYNTETTSTYYDSYYPTTGNKSITMGGKTYKNAIMLYSSGAAKIYFNLEGKYTTLTGIVGHIDEMSKDIQS